MVKRHNNRLINRMVTVLVIGAHKIGKTNFLRSLVEKNVSKYSPVTFYPQDYSFRNEDYVLQFRRVSSKVMRENIKNPFSIYTDKDKMARDYSADCDSVMLCVNLKGLDVISEIERMVAIKKNDCRVVAHPIIIVGLQYDATHQEKLKVIRTYLDNKYPGKNILLCAFDAINTEFTKVTGEEIETINRQTLWEAIVLASEPSQMDEAEDTSRVAVEPQRSAFFSSLLGFFCCRRSSANSESHESEPLINSSGPNRSI